MPGYPQTQPTSTSTSTSTRREFLQKSGAAILSATAATLTPGAWAQTTQKMVIAYPTITMASWPFWIAQHGGYYAQHGLASELKYVMQVALASVLSGDSHVTSSSLEQVLAASLRDPALVMCGSPLSLGSFALVAANGIRTVADLRGKRVGVARVGDTPYYYTLELLNKFGLTAAQVQWVATGMDPTARASMLANGQLDAALLTAPAYYKLLDTGRFNEVTNLMQHPDIPVTTVYVMRQNVLTANPQLAENLIKANAQAIKRFYEDKAFAIETYRRHDTTSDAATVGRIYDRCFENRAFERIPIVRRSTLDAAVRRMQHSLPAIKDFEFAKVVDNRIVRRLAASGWFEQLYGSQIVDEQTRRLQEGI